MKPNQGEQLLGSPPAAPERVYLWLDDEDEWRTGASTDEYEYVRADLARAPADQDREAAIRDIEKARISHLQWASFLRAGDHKDCKGCEDHAEHIGDAEYHDLWVAKYDNVLNLLAARAPAAADVAGRRCEWSLAELEHRCRVLIGEEQGKPLPDNALIAVLCNTVRFIREYIDDWAARAPADESDMEEVVDSAAKAIRETVGATAADGWTFEEISVLNDDLKAIVRTAVRAARAPAPPEEQDAARKAAEEIAKTFWEDQR